MDGGDDAMTTGPPPAAAAADSHTSVCWPYSINVGQIADLSFHIDARDRPTDRAQFNSDLSARHFSYVRHLFIVAQCREEDGKIRPGNLLGDLLKQLSKVALTL